MGKPDPIDDHPLLCSHHAREASTSAAATATTTGTTTGTCTQTGCKHTCDHDHNHNHHHHPHNPDFAGPVKEHTMTDATTNPNPKKPHDPNDRLLTEFQHRSQQVIDLLKKPLLLGGVGMCTTEEDAVEVYMDESVKVMDAFKRAGMPEGPRTPDQYDMLVRDRVWKRLTGLRDLEGGDLGRKARVGGVPR